LFSSFTLLAETVNDSWRPGIGDPTVLGWFTVAAYFAAALLLLRTWQADREATQAGQPACPGVWLLVALVLLLLGLNKQLDLQSLITVIGRRVARDGGWYGERRHVQRLFILGVLAAAVMSALGLAWVVRRHLRRVAPMLLGLTVLLAFIVIRAASFHNMDHWLGSSVIGLRWNGVLELGGIVLTALGAAWAAQPPPPTGPIPIRFGTPTHHS
jgi:hypothetical protein